MKYVKKSLDPQTVDTLRIGLSVYEPKLGPEPHCDFCGDPEPVVKYAAKVMSTGERRNCWRWLACAPCSQAIERGAWHTIHARMVAAVIERLRLTRADDKAFRMGTVLAGIQATEYLKRFRDNAITEEATNETRQPS